MAARFPQSGSSVAYKIKAAYASKIKVLYWAASADSVHRLRPGDTATTIVSRSATGAGFNADGRITGTNTSTYFSDSEANGINEQDDICLGFFGYGDAFNGVGTNSIALIQTRTPPDVFDDGAKLRAKDYGIDFNLRGGGGGSLSAGVTNDVPAYIDVAVRRNATDPINTLRQWLNGAEQTSVRTNAAASSSATISNLYFGGSYTGTGNTSIQWEGCFFASGDLTDAELDAITADPTVLIEPASSAAELAGTATASATATGDLTTTPAVKGVSIQLGDGTPAANLTGLSVRWWDASTPTGAPDYESDVETTDASGWLEIDLSAVTALAIGANGYLHVFKAGATPADDMVAAGRVPISDIA